MAGQFERSFPQGLKPLLPALFGTTEVVPFQSWAAGTFVRHPPVLSNNQLFFFWRKDISHAANLRAHAAQLLLDSLVAAIHVIDAIENGFSIGYQRS